MMQLNIAAYLQRAHENCCRSAAIYISMNPNEGLYIHYLRLTRNTLLRIARYSISM